jgi:CDP-ribitol ribitolphosphotransferase
MGLFIRIAKLFLATAYFFMKLGSVEDKVVFLSRQGDEPSVDYAALRASLEAAGVRTETRLQRQEKDSARFMAGAAANLRVILDQMRALSGARVAVTDGYSIPISILKHRKELTVIQVWHAIGAVKKFGLQTVPVMADGERRRAKLMRMHAGYDYFVAPSEAAARFFAEAFGMSADRALLTGSPRLDALYDGRFDRRDEIAAAYPELAENDENGHPLKVVLYAPTYRKNAPKRGGDSEPDGNVGAGARGEGSAEARVLREALGAGAYEVIEKRHPIDAADDRGFSAEELMYAADIVVTDYSSIAIAAALIGKPLYFYLYDIDGYSRSPGLNIDPEREYGRYCARDAEELARLIRAGGYDAAYARAFAGKYVETFDGRCAERLTDAILRAGRLSRCATAPPRLP